MRNTHRALNRTLLLIIGLVVLAVGAALIALVAVPGAADLWKNGADGVRAWADGVGEPAFGIGTVAVMVIVAVVLIALPASAVRGSSRVPLESTGAESAAGRIVVTDGFASEALKNSIAERDEILAARVSSNEVRKETVLHVSITPRQNTSPREIAAYVDTLVSNLATLTGQTFRTYISVHSSLRARLAHDQRRLS